MVFVAKECAVSRKGCWDVIAAMEAIPGDDVVRGEVTAPSATLVEQEVKPLGYHLILQPTVGRRESIHNNTIRGRAFIRLLLLKEHLTTIRLHALKIAFSRACLSVGEGGTAQKLPQEITVDTEAELVSFRFDEELPANVPLELEVDYVTPVYTNREFRGVYECPFLESPSGDEEYASPSPLSVPPADLITTDMCAGWLPTLSHAILAERSPASTVPPSKPLSR